MTATLYPKAMKAIFILIGLVSGFHDGMRYQANSSQGLNSVAVSSSPIPDYEEKGRILVFGSIGIICLLGGGFWLGCALSKGRGS